MSLFLKNFKTIFLLLFFFYIGPALSQEAACIADLVPGWVNQLKNVAQILAIISYVVGVFFLIKAIMKIKEHTETKGQVKISVPIFHFAASALLLSLPSIMELGVQAVIGMNATTGVSLDGNISNQVCSSSSSTAPGSVGDMFANFKPSALALYEFAFYAAWVIGVSLMITAIFRFAQLGSNPQMHPKTPIINFVVGAFLIAMTSTLNLVGQSIATGGWDSSRNPGSILVNSPRSIGAQVDIIQQGILAFLMLIGIIAVIRGWLLLNQMAMGKEGVLGRGLTHIFGGVMLINLHNFGPIIAKSLGW